MAQSGIGLRLPIPRSIPRRSVKHPHTRALTGAVIGAALRRRRRLEQDETLRMGYPLVALEGAAVRRNVARANAAIIAARIGGEKRL